MILPRQRRARVSALVAVLAALLLTGCGSSLGIHPGAAAAVGDQTVSMSKIDDTSTLYCKAYVTQSQAQAGQSGPIPMGSFRSYVASGLAKRLLGEALADQYAVQPAPGYQQQVSQLRQALASTPADQRDAVIEIASADAYLQNVQLAIGRQLTGNTGQTNQDVKAALQRGEVATQEWLNGHHVSIDPVFGIAVDGGRFSPSRDETSYPLSPLASSGAQAATSQQGPPAAYTAALPANQLCQ